MLPTPLYPDLPALRSAMLPVRSRPRWAEGAGHDPTHPAMVHLMVKAIDSYATNGSFEAAQAA